MSTTGTMLYNAAVPGGGGEDNRVRPLMRSDNEHGMAVIDHDRLFKALLSTFFVDFLDLFFPDLSAGLVHDSWRFLDKELCTDVTSGERYEADLVVQGQMQGQASFFLIHVEHQAQADFGRRMFRYFARLHDRYALPVYPLCSFRMLRHAVRNQRHIG